MTMSVINKQTPQKPASSVFNKNTDVEDAVFETIEQAPDKQTSRQAKSVAKINIHNRLHSFSTSKNTKAHSIIFSVDSCFKSRSSTFSEYHNISFKKPIRGQLLLATALCVFTIVLILPGLTLGENHDSSIQKVAFETNKLTVNPTGMKDNTSSIIFSPRVLIVSKGNFSTLNISKSTESDTKTSLSAIDTDTKVDHKTDSVIYFNTK